MKIFDLLKRIVYPHSYSSEAYIQYLRAGGVIIGNNTKIYSPNHVNIDTNKKYLITIGDYCKITKGVTILAHDYSRSVASRVYGQFVGGSLPVKIGDNVFIGEYAMILMGTTIGDNCIIGAHSVVKGTFPSNVVIAGNSAKVICSLEQYYEKARLNWVNDAKECAKAIFEHTGRAPTVDEMSDTYMELYLPHTQETIDKYPKMFNRTADDKEKIKKDFLNSKPLYDSFEDFIKDCNLTTER